MGPLAILHSTIRAEEKRILEAAHARGVEVRLVDVRTEVFDPRAGRPEYGAALERSVSTVKGNYGAAFLESLGIAVVNPCRVALVCQDKFLTSLRLREAGLPVPPFALAFSAAAARRAVEALGGYPVVLKPPLGSWGRLLAKVNDEDALEALVEHKEVLGTPPQKPLYLQAFIRKPGRDIRAFIVGGETIAAIFRESPHWITNTARGGAARACPVTEDLRALGRRTSEAIGGGLLAVDYFETDHGLAVNEVNHTMEFRNSEEPTGVDIAGAIIGYLQNVMAGAGS